MCVLEVLVCVTGVVFGPRTTYLATLQGERQCSVSMGMPRYQLEFVWCAHLSALTQVTYVPNTVVNHYYGCKLRSPPTQGQSARSSCNLTHGLWPTYLLPLHPTVQHKHMDTILDRGS